ncbi:MAG: hypothetical protein LJE70_12525 [Chromatiaceae bacterium]|nr:hypothetical protein [Chromatiaceae bacterium]
MLRSPYLYVPLLALLVGAYWLHALQVPFWQDDFHFLGVARSAREAGEGWASVFWPGEKSIFWRPLSEGLYWRFVEGALDADPLAAHAVNLLFLIAATLAVAWLVADYAPLVAPGADPRKAFMAAGLLYGIHAAHLIPAIWATAVHSSMVVLFAALALRFWVSALRDSPAGWSPGLLSAPVFLLLALLSKENGILVLPLGALLTASVWDRLRPSRAAWRIAGVSLLLASGWLWIRQEMVVVPSGAYEMGIGINAVRNLTAMGLFFFNVPRESLRFMLEQQSAPATLWALACGLAQAAAVWVVLAAARPRLRLRAWLAAIAFFLIASAPYLLFSWNSYAYYISLGLIVWPFLVAVAPLSARKARLVLAAALISSGLSVAGNYALDYPALLARAEWANRQLANISAQFPAVAERARARGIEVLVENRHKFLGIGIPGLAYELDLSPQKIRVVAPQEPVSSASVRLVIPDSGDARFE